MGVGRCKPISDTQKAEARRLRLLGMSGFLIGKQLGISPVSVHKYTYDIKVPDKKDLERAREIMTLNREGVVDAGGVSEEKAVIKKPLRAISDEELKKETVAQLRNRILQTGDPNAAFRLAQIKGWIVEKKEVGVKISVDADEVARQHFEAERQLLAGGHRMAQMSKERSLLSDPARPDNQQKHEQDGKVGSVGLPA